MRNDLILITGADGFIGQALARRLADDNRRLVQVVRKLDNPACPGIFSPSGTIDAHTDWGDLLAGVKVVVHLAARTHALAEKKPDDLEAFREVNVAGTLNLARQAVKAGVKRFIYLSSIKVNGEQTGTRPFRAADPPAPVNAYGRSKFEAEQGLDDIARQKDLEVVIIRPPLVYGPGVKANFLRLLNLVRQNPPLPLGLVKNQRSMVYLENLVDLIAYCLSHPAAPGEIFLVSDGRDLSTPQLFEQLAVNLNQKARLLPVPVTLLRLAAKLLGRASDFDRLCGSLQVDISRTQRLLDWQPPFTPEEGLWQTARWLQGKK